MHAPPRDRQALWTSAVLFAIMSAWALFNATAMLALAVPVVVVLLWFKGFVRFVRVRAKLRATGRGFLAFIRTRRLTAHQLRTLGIVVGVLVLLFVLDKLGLSAPGKGRGLSIPVGAFSLDFGGSIPANEVAATVTSYAILAALLFWVWFRFWQGVHEARVRMKTVLLWVGVGLFVGGPAAFTLVMATAAPKDPVANVDFAKGLLPVALMGVTLGFAGAAALPHYGAGRARVLAAQPTSRPASAATTSGPVR